MRVFRIMSKNARSFKMTVGISLQHFDFLICDVEKAHQQAEFVRPDRPDRRRRGWLRPQVLPTPSGTGSFRSSCTTGPT